MGFDELLFLFFATILINNFVLSKFLGICPFVGVSGRLSSALGMGFAVTFVMTLTAIVSWLIYNAVLVPLGAEYLKIVAFIVVIASLVQLVEMYLKKFFPELYRAFGIFLPMITTNCAIMGSALLIVDYDYGPIPAVIFGFAGGIGFTLAITIMAGIREELETADIPKCMKGTAITLIVAGLLALAFMGFSGFGQ